MTILRFLADLRPPMLVLGCYLVWYAVTVLHHFDPSPRLWLNALGIGVLIGSALVLSVGRAALHVAGRWAIVRLYLMPFCVSSFSSLIKDRGFVLVLSPDAPERLQALAACLGLLLAVAAARAITRRTR